MKTNSTRNILSLIRGTLLAVSFFCALLIDSNEVLAEGWTEGAVSQIVNSQVETFFFNVNDLISGTFVKSYQRVAGDTNPKSFWVRVQMIDLYTSEILGDKTETEQATDAELAVAYASRSAIIGADNVNHTIKMIVSWGFTPNVAVGSQNYYFEGGC